MSIRDLGHSFTMAKNHSPFKVKLFFSETVETFETKFHIKAYGITGIKTICKRSGSHDQDGHHAHIW